MQHRIQTIKKITNELEKCVAIGNKIYIERLLDEMMDTCRKCKLEIETKKNTLKNIKLETINEIQFIYKPILKKNYFEGTYLEEFSKKRSEDLKNAKAFEGHNKFWQTYETLRGNVFGSVPKDLISQDAVRNLMRYGWDEVNVNVLEVVERDCTIKELVEYCELNFSNFLIVKEKASGAEMILHYQI